MNPTPTAAELPKDRKPRWWESRWFLSLVVLIFGIIAFYVGADWFGEAAWQKAQAEITAAGESLDPNKYIPPPVPDAQNFGALPIFQLEREPSSSSSGNTVPLKLRAALEMAEDHIPYSKEEVESNRDQLPYLGKWEKEKSPIYQI